MATQSVLTEAEKEHFLTHGWIKIGGAFTREQVDEKTKDVWARLGMDPSDKSTWSRLRTHMPHHNTFDAQDFAPRAWAAICEICGGDERISDISRQWRDSFIVNLGTQEGENKEVNPKELTNWHVDGDFFVHFLDSPEQGLLVIPLFSDIIPGGGGTIICPGGIPKFAEWLYQHPEGVSPRMVPRGHDDFEKERNLDFYNNIIQGADEFIEATGNAGDVYILHPLMLHSATTNPRRQIRIITNPPIGLKEPFCFDREDGKYSLIERATLKALGKESLPGWKPTAKRQGLVPERVRIQQAMKVEELKRLESLRQVKVTA